MACDYHCLCTAFGPYDARCVSVDSCPSYQEPICSSNGTTYDNKCLFEQEMCLLQLNFTVQHPGSCEGKQILPVYCWLGSLSISGTSLCELGKVCCRQIIERLNGVNRQPSNGQKFNRQPSKKGKFYRQPSKKQLLLILAVKRFQGLSNLTISAAHLGLLALKESF